MSFKAKDWRVLCIDYRKAVVESNSYIRDDDNLVQDNK